jgi:hypothetical protein
VDQRWPVGRIVAAASVIIVGTGSPSPTCRVPDTDRRSGNGRFWQPPPPRPLGSRAAPGPVPAVDAGVLPQRPVRLRLRARRAMGPSRLAAALSEGASLSVLEAVGYARRGRGRRGRPSFGWASLTSTERSVVELVVDGLTNAEIGGRLFVSDARSRAISPTSSPSSGSRTGAN